jgi:imidazolonepropionase-like amidohydrolase
MMAICRRVEPEKLQLASGFFGLYSVIGLLHGTLATMKPKIIQIQAILFAMALVLPTGSVIAGADQPNQNDSTLSIIGATLIDGKGAEPIHNATVIIRDGAIECAGDRQHCTLDPNATILNATGKWLVPGFIDSHVHWQIWYDEQKALSPERAASAARLYLANGITTLIDVGGQRWVNGANRRVLDELQESGQPAPRMFYSGWIDRKVIEESGSRDAGVVATELLAGGAVGIKVHNGLNQQDYQRITAAADRTGHPVYGHTYYINENGFLNLTPEGLSAGVDGIFHILGIPPVSPQNMPLLPTEPMDNWQAWWLAGAKLWLHVNASDMDKLIDLMVSNQAWLQPTMVTEHTMIQPDYYRESPDWVHSPVSWENLQFGRPVLEGDDLFQYTAAYRQMETFVKRFYEAGGMVVAGTDGLPIPAFGLHEEVRLLIEAGLPPMAGLQSATRSAATAWHVQDQIGILQKGHAADLLILAGDPLLDITQTKNIWRVIQSGFVYDPEELLNQAVDLIP